ncbi:hypothetical protein [Streptomyces sp. NPDC002215]|uniref:hypothetical protein n=1 Tax=Streptomyces sp. NPDC002215 TaxID=3154412 RepID=UPI00332F2474
MTTPADELHAAARKLRSAASALGSAPGISDDWIAEGTTVSQGRYPDTGEPVYPVAEAASPQCATLIALMHPGVGLALADWLDSWIGVDLSEHGPMPEDARHALAVARQILGTAGQSCADCSAALRPGMDVELEHDCPAVTEEPKP